jgi:hypothetical protein
MTDILHSTGVRGEEKERARHRLGFSICERGPAHCRVFDWSFWEVLALSSSLRAVCPCSFKDVWLQ